MPTLYDAWAERVAEHHDIFGRILNGENVFTNVPTGIERWDRNGGIERGVTTLLCLASGHGKSHVALQLARTPAQMGMSVGLLSFEDPKDRTVDRLLANSTGIDSGDLGRISYDESCLAQLMASLKEAEWAKKVDYQHGLKTSKEVFDYIAESTHDIDIIDYAQAIPEAPGRTLEQTLSDAAWDWNKAAQDRKKAVVVFAQVKPDVDVRGRAFFDANRQRGYPVALSGYRPGPGKADVPRCTALYDRSKVVGYGWRPGKLAKQLSLMDKGVPVKDDHIEWNFDKWNFGVEGSLKVGFDGAHSRLYDYKEAK